MDELYDEFGNFIGDAGSEDDVQSTADAADAYILDDEASIEDVQDQQFMEADDGPSNAVILHEDKQYYPSASDVYGPDVEVLVQEEDTQALSQPIIEPVVQKKFTVQEEDLPPVHYSRELMTDLMNYPDQIRNIVIAGHLHHGKTAFMDMLVMETHDIQDRLDKKRGKKREEQLRYTDVHIVERQRGLSIKAAPMTLVLPNISGKSHLFNIIDTPGHVNFADELAASMRLADGMVLVVDIIEGVQVTTELAIKHAVLEDLPLTLVVNKMDRLILELKLPPKDAYFKIKHVIEEVNTVIENTIPGRGESRRVSPEKGNVAFACTSMRWCFTLRSFVQMYSDFYSGPSKASGFGKPTKHTNLDEFARRCWGDIFYNPGSRKFTRKPQEERSNRSFVTWILEPIYKLYSHTISESPEDLKETLGRLGIRLKPSDYKADAKELMRLVCQKYFGPSTGFVDMVLKHVPSPADGAKRMLQKHYTGPLDSKTAEIMDKCDQNGPLIIHVTKLFNTTDAKAFHCLGRVMSGVATTATSVRVLGEGYTIEDEEDMVVATITDTWIAESRYNVPTSGVPAGNWVLLGGVDNSIVKTATLVAQKLLEDEDAYIFRPIRHFFESVFKVAVEPINPSELPKMLDGLRKVNKSFPLVTTKVEESGEHIILGTGELYMDSVLHDLRRLYADMDIKVSDPVTRFCETVVETSAIKCYAFTPNKKNKITMIAESLDPGIAEDIEAGKVSIKDPVRVVGKFFEERYGYDLLASRNIWAFGPDDMGANILQNDTLPSEVDTKTLRSVRDTIRQGFSWATREGPLCEEPIRNTKFRITDVELASEAIFRGGGQIIPTSRRACYSSFLMASPRLMEPVYSCSMIGAEDTKPALYNVLSKRRGHVLQDGPIAGTPLYNVRGLIPVIDSFGFETDLKVSARKCYWDSIEKGTNKFPKLHTKGKVSLSLVFDRWSIVPGDPLDKSIKLRPLEPATAQAIARDFVLKTRRRKGLAEDVTISKFLEPELFRSLRDSGVLESGQ